MQIKRALKPRTRHVHSVTIEDDVWAAVIDYAIEHNVNPGEVVEAAIRKHLNLKQAPGDFG